MARYKPQDRQPQLRSVWQREKESYHRPDSATMSTNHGVLQGYNGIAVVDAKHQIVVTAQGHGEGKEAHLQAPLINNTREQCQDAKLAKDVFAHTKLVADAGYSSQHSVRYT